MIFYQLLCQIGGQTQEVIFTNSTTISIIDNYSYNQRDTVDITKSNPFVSIEYVTQCFYDRHNHQTCDWTRDQMTVSPTGKKIQTFVS